MKENKSKDPKQKLPMKYWMVDIELTSGDRLQFYVKALTLGDAYDKADSYAEWTSNDQLLNKLKGFKLMA